MAFEDFFEEVCFFIGVFQFGFEVCQGACPQGDGPDIVVTEFGFGGEVQDTSIVTVVEGIGDA